MVGGGAGGVELAMAAHYRLLRHHEQEQADTRNSAMVHDNKANHVTVSLVTKSELLESHNWRVRSIFRRILRERNIRLYENAPVKVVDGVRKKLHIHTEDRPHLVFPFFLLLLLLVIVELCPKALLAF